MDKHERDLAKRIAEALPQLTDMERKYLMGVIDGMAMAKEDRHED